jgi:hypothetical protein
MPTRLPVEPGFLRGNNGEINDYVANAGNTELRWGNFLNMDIVAPSKEFSDGVDCSLLSTFGISVIKQPASHDRALK